MRPSTILAAACAAVFAAFPASAQTPRQAVLSELEAASAAPASGGYVPDARAAGRANLLGELPRDGTVRLELTLRAGRRYRIVAACDDECEDLDLRALAADGEAVLGEDVEADARPVLSFVADASGPHLLSVTMAGCKTGFCAFGVRILSR